MKNEARTFLLYCKNQARILVMILAVLAFLLALDLVFHLSFYEWILGVVEEFYAKWGMPFLFLVSLIEGMLFVNWYFPGSTAILVGGLLTRTGVIPFWDLVLVGWSGFFLAFLLDYCIGRYGAYYIFKNFSAFQKHIESAKRALEKRNVSTFFIWYVHPQTGSFVATAAGVLHYAFGKFLALNALALACWILFWASLVYVFGDIVLRLLDNYFFAVAIGALTLWILVGYSKERKTLLLVP